MSDECVCDPNGVECGPDCECPMHFLTVLPPEEDD